MTAKVIPMKPSKPPSPLTVTPEGGWEPYSQYGPLMDEHGKPLERLEAVHALLMKRDGLTPMGAAACVFGPFVADSNSKLGGQLGADKLRTFLMLIDKSDKAYPLFPSRSYSSSQLKRLKELVPHIPHPHFDRDTPEALLYSLGLMAGEVWAPHSGDFDLNDRPCFELAESYLPTAAKAREILGPLAVRHTLAHVLWGWGMVVGAADSPQTHEGANPPARKLKLHERAPEWTGGKLLKRQAELKRECKEQGTRNFTQLLCKESGLPPREVTRRIQPYKNDRVGNPMPGMVSQLKKKA